MCGGDFMSKNLEEAMDFLIMWLKFQEDGMNQMLESYGKEIGELEMKKPPQYTQPAQAPQQASNLEQAIVNLSKVVGDFVGDQKSINAQLNKRIDSVEMQVSVKYKDPGCPTISVSIGGTCVEKALLDLRASVNLLYYSVYKHLGLGELKPTSITLSLADRSVKIPRGMIEDVLVQVDKFYYPVDFVEWSHATHVGNMTLELNIFHLYKKHIHLEEEEGPKEVCMIDTLVEEHYDQRMQEI
ncbi:hypothetical protein CK203_112713 [Vitis vinifera]|uniref:Uncharacterized protein n=1 Tax=Vitis vinifera TaxID=29760 RepID=A0A438CCZ7_VITVI|nr:hypothetical protein CK203_112713 [Vitis vinifera]